MYLRRRKFAIFVDRDEHAPGHVGVLLRGMLDADRMGHVRLVDVRSTLVDARSNYYEVLRRLASVPERGLPSRAPEPVLPSRAPEPVLPSMAHERGPPLAGTQASEAVPSRIRSAVSNAW